MFEKKVNDFIVEASDTYFHVVTYVVTQNQALKLMKEFQRDLKQFWKQIVIISYPTDPSSYNGHVGCRISILALPEVAAEVKKIAFE